MKGILQALACYVVLSIFFGCVDGERYTGNRNKRPAKEKRLNDKARDEHSLTREEQSTLLKIARDTIESYVRDRKIPDLGNYHITDRLRENCGAFVTITNPASSNPVYPEALRGCIGNFIATKALCETVREMAVAACSSDTRFPPVRANELGDIEVEISALSPLMPSKEPLSIKKGVHGIYIRSRQGVGGGTYLPQVWSNHFPDKDAEDFWTHLCRFKAGLPADAWRHPELYDIRVYTADVFGEKDE